MNLLTESGLDNVDNGLACINIGHDLSSTFGLFSALF